METLVIRTFVLKVKRQKIYIKVVYGMMGVKSLMFVSDIKRASIFYLNCGWSLTKQERNNAIPFRHMAIGLHINNRYILKKSKIHESDIIPVRRGCITTNNRHNIMLSNLYKDIPYTYYVRKKK